MACFTYYELVRANYCINFLPSFHVSGDLTSKSGLQHKWPINNTKFTCRGSYDDSY